MIISCCDFVTAGTKHKTLLILDKLNSLIKYNKGLTKYKKKDITNEQSIPPFTLETLLKNKLDIEQNGLVGGNK